MKYRVLSLFSGAMGLDLGLEAAGFHVAACCEVDKWCCETIRENKPRVRVYENRVQELDPKEIAFDNGLNATNSILAGGPPCQSFSSAGKRAALNDPRGNLVFEYFRYVRDIRPRAFIFENVGNILTATIKHRPIHMRPGKHWNLAKYSRENVVSEGVPPMEDDEMSGSAFRHLLSEIAALDYSVTFGIMNSADYGAPQKRIRFCMLGFRDVGALGMPPPTHGAPPLLPRATLRDAIGDLAETPGTHSVYTERIANYFNKIPTGGNWKSLSEPDQKEILGGSYDAGGGKTGFMRRLSWDIPCPTLTTKANRKGTALCHPDQTRPLSVEEYKRIQGFPDEWNLTGAMNQQYQQIGNAVPVALGIALGHHVRRTLKRAQPKSVPSLRELEISADAALVYLRSFARNNQNGTKSSNQLTLGLTE